MYRYMCVFMYVCSCMFTAGSSWYLVCDTCREKYMKAGRAGAGRAHGNRSRLGRKKPVIVTPAVKTVISPATSIGNLDAHLIMKNNAMFLLDLASSANIGTLHMLALPVILIYLKQYINVVFYNTSNSCISVTVYHSRILQHKQCLIRGTVYLYGIAQVFHISADHQLVICRPSRRTNHLLTMVVHSARRRRSSACALWAPQHRTTNHPSTKKSCVGRASKTVTSPAHHTRDKG